MTKRIEGKINIFTSYPNIQRVGECLTARLHEDAALTGDEQRWLEAITSGDLDGAAVIADAMKLRDKIDLDSPLVFDLIYDAVRVALSPGRWKRINTANFDFGDELYLYYGFYIDGLCPDLHDINMRMLRAFLRSKAFAARANAAFEETCGDEQ